MSALASDPRMIVPIPSVPEGRYLGTWKGQKVSWRIGDQEWEASTTQIPQYKDLVSQSRDRDDGVRVVVAVRGGVITIKILDGDVSE